jgi:hypothetical protein
MVFLDRAGRPLLDHEIVSGKAAQAAQPPLTAPPGAARAVIAALGCPPAGDTAQPGSPGAVSLWAAPPGRAPVCGWQTGSLLAQLAPATLLARGAIVQLASPLVTRRDGRRTSQALLHAATAIAGQPSSVTWLPAAADLVLVIVDAAGTPGILPQVSMDGEPTVIAAGRRRYLLYPVTGREPGQPLLAVRVDSSPHWQLAGVLGLPGRLDSWTPVLAGRTAGHLVPDWPLSPHGPVTVQHKTTPINRGEPS